MFLGINIDNGFRYLLIVLPPKIASFVRWVAVKIRQINTNKYHHRKKAEFNVTRTQKSFLPQVPQSQRQGLLTSYWLSGCNWNHHLPATCRRSSLGPALPYLSCHSQPRMQHPPSGASLFSWCNLFWLLILKFYFTKSWLSGEVVSSHRGGVAFLVPSLCQLAPSQSDVTPIRWAMRLAAD